MSSDAFEPSVPRTQSLSKLTRLALTHLPSPRLAECQRTYVEEAPIDLRRAHQQHDHYCARLAALGASVRRLEINPDYPDSVFVEDTVVVLDELAVLASMGHASRRGETRAMESVVSEYRRVEHLSAAARLEGGDVLRVGRQLLVGLSQRTNRAGFEELRELAAPLGYQVRPLRVGACLHLKSACTALPDGTLLVNPDWLDSEELADFTQLTVARGEEHGANLLLLGEQVLISSAYRATAEALRSQGYTVESLDVSEFAKAEGCLTCMSVLLDINSIHGPGPTLESL